MEIYYKQDSCDVTHFTADMHGNCLSGFQGIMTEKAELI